MLFYNKNFVFPPICINFAWQLHLSINIGMWRSWLAYASGGRVVASSSLVIPTTLMLNTKGGNIS